MFKTVGFLSCLNSYCKIIEDKQRNLFTAAGLAIPTDSLYLLCFQIDQLKDSVNCLSSQGMFSLQLIPVPPLLVVVTPVVLFG